MSEIKTYIEQNKIFDATAILLDALQSSVSLLDTPDGSMPQPHGMSQDDLYHQALRRTVYPDMTDSEKQGITLCAQEITRDEIPRTDRDSLFQILSALQKELRMRPDSLPDSNVGQLFTEVLSRAWYEGWAPFFYKKIRADFEKSSPPDENMKILLDHGENVCNMIYSRDMRFTSILFQNITQAISVIDH